MCLKNVGVLPHRRPLVNGAVRRSKGIATSDSPPLSLLFADKGEQPPSTAFKQFGFALPREQGCGRFAKLAGMDDGASTARVSFGDRRGELR